MAFIVPEKFLRNAKDVLDLGPPADIGVSLLQYMCERIGISDLAGLDVLDFGCGTRFADSIVNRCLPLKSYVGIDVDKPMIDFLRSNVVDPRMSFFHLNARNIVYNPDGEPIDAAAALPIGNRRFDLACMFSVITHQMPDDARAIFSVLRRYVRSKSWLFFSAKFEEGDFGYRESMPESPTALSIYTPALIKVILKGAGWRVVSMVPPQSRRFGDP